MKIYKILLFLALFSNLLAKDIISVSIDPLAFIVEQISKKSLEINVVIPANADEHHLDIKPATMKSLENSSIYFTAGLEFEENLIKTLKSNYKELLIVDLSKGIEKIPMGEDFDPHIWLDPMIAASMGEKVAKSLIAKYPKNAKAYKQNLKDFKLKMLHLDKKVEKLLEELKKPFFISYHPSWGYFAKRYRLVQIPIEKDGKEPKFQDLIRLIDFIKKHKINTIFVQDGFDTKPVATIQKECDLKLVKLNHLDRDYENMLILAAKKIANAGK